MHENKPESQKDTHNEINNRCAIVIFGATGDLTKRKIIPAIYRLMVSEKLSDFIIIGVSIDQTTPETIIKKAEQFIPDLDRTILQKLQERFYYHQLNFADSDHYKTLHSYLQKLEIEYQLPGNRLIYLACSASFFSIITNNIAQTKLATRKSELTLPWHRIVYEKPFGHDLISAGLINQAIAESFNENQIYRIDHYLTKELVSNILLLRFANSFFEPLWNNKYIEEVQIILSEQVAVENRGAYYDQYGALCDVVQNHILELMALIAMEAPHTLTGDFIREQRAKVLEKLEINDGYLGQYDGYLNHHGVSPHSKTDTFAVLCATIDTPRWHGVPFYLKTGKSLDKKETIIHIKFKSIATLFPSSALFSPKKKPESNWLTIRIVPEATFFLTLNIKKLGQTDELIPVAMEFCHSCIFGERSPEEAYEILLEQIIKGQQSIAVRFDEIEYAWRIIDHIKKRELPLYTYEQRSTGPLQDILFQHKHAMTWRS